MTLEMLLGLICSAFSEAVLLASIVTMCGILSSATGLALAGWTAMYILSIAGLVAVGMSTYYMIQQWQIYLATGDGDAAEYVFRMGAMLGLGALVDALLIKITSTPEKPGGGEEPGSGGGNNSPKGLVGHDFEDYLTKTIGGEGSFSVGGREFDGGVGNRWWEAKSGNYWDILENNPKELMKFKSDMGNRLSIATENEATYELFSNTPIPEAIKQWLTGKGIPFTELLD